MLLNHACIRDLIDMNPQTGEELHEVKRTLAHQYSIAVPSHSTLLKAYKQFIAEQKLPENQTLLKLLRRRSVRTLSGVAPVTVLTKPYPCPGRCAYCPTDVRMPKSYLSKEPAAQRALMNAFDPFKQVESRIQQLEANGHVADKIELIVLGGTWSFYPQEYQTDFIRECFNAANNNRSETLEDVHKQNEISSHRIIGLDLETRPDYVSPDELWRMRKLGCTHVQVGVQSLDQAVLDLVHRDDTIEGVAKATKLLKHFGFKFTYHIMPGLPGSTPEKDIRTIEMLFSDERFQPDMLKIYPTLVLENSLLYQWWKNGDYTPYDDATLTELLLEIKKRIPPYVRINRLIRDIPGDDIIAGNRVTNLRQKLQEQGADCQCIRCREARGRQVSLQDARLVVRSYPSSGGHEHFISYESGDKKIIYAFVRLFLASQDIQLFETKTAFVRELHTYGELMPVGSGKQAVQHIGFGKRLLQEAEHRAREAGYSQLAVIAGIGVKEYYRKLGYQDSQTYLVKRLT